MNKNTNNLTNRGGDLFDGDKNDWSRTRRATTFFNIPYVFYLMLCHSMLLRDFLNKNFLIIFILYNNSLCSSIVLLQIYDKPPSYFYISFLCV